MTNQTWKRNEESFECSDGRRIKVSFAHGGLEMQTGGNKYSDPWKTDYLPTTWGRLSLLPNPDESIDDFVERNWDKDEYQERVEEYGKKEIDKDLRQTGLGLIQLNTAVPEAGNACDLESFEKTLAESPAKLDDDTLLEVLTFAEEQLDGKALDEAQAAFNRTGGKPSGEIKR